MLLMMAYWEDDVDDKRKLAKHLKRKKETREATPPPASAETNATAELTKALEIIHQQSLEREESNKQITTLVESLQRTQALLEEALKSNQPGNYKVVYKPENCDTETVKPKNKPFMPKLEDIDVALPEIDTSGIEVGGKAGERVETGTGNSNKVNKLKEIMKKRSKE